MAALDRSNTRTAGRPSAAAHRPGSKPSGTSRPGTSVRGTSDAPSTVAAVETSEPVGRYVRMVAVEGQGPELAKALLRVADGMADQPGCRAYVVNAAPDEPETVWVTELWADAASSEAALGRDLGEAGLGEVLALLAAPPEYIEVVPLGGPGLG